MKIFEDKKVIKVACGPFHNLALTANAQVFSWGVNSDGQLGHTDMNTATPLRIKVGGRQEDIPYIWDVVAVSPCGCTFRLIFLYHMFDIFIFVFQTMTGTPLWDVAAGQFHSVVVSDGVGFTPDIYYTGREPEG